MTHYSRRFALRLLSTLATPWVLKASLASPENEERGTEARVGRLIAHTRQLLAGLHAAELTPFRAEWPAAPPLRRTDPSTVPVLRWLPETLKAAPRFSHPVAQALIAAAPSLAWRRSYSAAAVGEEFYERYGWTELVGLTGPLPGEHLACGFLVLGPEVTYPRHRHEAEEIYIPLSGTARWQGGDGRWIEQAPGSVIHHAREEPHAMQTAARPLLALYLWRSENLAQKSRLDPAPGAGG